MRKPSKSSRELIERAVRMVIDGKDQYSSQWAVVESIAGSASSGHTMCTVAKELAAPLLELRTAVCEAMLRFADVCAPRRLISKRTRLL